MHKPCPVYIIHNVIIIDGGTAAIGPDTSEKETDIPSNNGLML